MSQDPLDSLLDRWNRVPGSPSRLEAEVWGRIAVEVSDDQTTGTWDRIEAVFRRPSFACAFVIACILAGLFVAEVRLAHMHAERSAQIARSYLHLIDPLLVEPGAVRPLASTNPAAHKS